MLILDSDHLAEIDRSSPIGLALSDRLRKQSRTPATTIVSIEEQLRGWLALLNRERVPERLIIPYSRLQSRLGFYSKWTVLPFDLAAAGQLEALARSKLRIGSMDLRIASIVLAVRGATLLSRNLVDFSKVPGLAVESWL